MVHILVASSTVSYLQCIMLSNDYIKHVIMLSYHTLNYIYGMTNIHALGRTTLCQMI